MDKIFVTMSEMFNPVSVIRKIFELNFKRLENMSRVIELNVLLAKHDTILSISFHANI